MERLYARVLTAYDTAERAMTDPGMAHVQQRRNMFFIVIMRYILVDS